MVTILDFVKMLKFSNLANLPLLHMCNMFQQSLQQ